MTAAGGSVTIRGPRSGILRRFFTRQDGRRAPIYDTLQFALLSGLLVWLSVRGAEAMGYNWKWYMVPRYMYRVIDEELIWGPLMRGLFVTLEIGAGSLVLTIFIGLVAVLLRLSDSFAARALVRVYLEVIRNTPLLVQLFLFFYILAPIFGIDRFWTGVLALSFFEGAHAMEIFRAGILSVGRGQWEASDSLGLPTVDTYRFIVLPQALRLVLPPLTGLVITLVKHSAIVSAIAIADLTTAGRNVIADTFLSFEIWFTVAGMYLVLTIALSLFVSYLEHRLRIRY
jgi:polar amino acid transport system permease protein